MSQKYIFVLGGCLSSLGKGVLSSSIGALLETKNHKVNMIKCDPYLNTSASSIDPTEHGESFVLEDGWCSDLDLGNYRRFTHSKLSRANSITSGQVYSQIFENERNGVYKGQTIQVIPHISQEIKNRIKNSSKEDDVINIVEIGGTVGDLESQVYIEAVRQLVEELNSEGEKRALVVYLTLIIRMSNGEIKTKPVQHSVRDLTEFGLTPDILICREKDYLSEEVINKLKTFCGLSADRIFTSVDVPSIYMLPSTLEHQGLPNLIEKLLNLKKEGTDKFSQKFWLNTVVEHNQFPRVNQDEVSIGIVGDYVSNPDAYKSVEEALCSVGLFLDAKINVDYIAAERINSLSAEDILDGYDGIIIPGTGFSKNFDNLLEVCKYTRENKIPCFGIDLGMVALTAEYLKNIANLDIQNSDESEFLFKERDSKRCGLFELCFKNNEASKTTNIYKFCVSDNPLPVKSWNRPYSGSSEIYNTSVVFNLYYKDILARNGLILGPFYDSETYDVESIEYPNGLSFGVAFHPEFKTRASEPHPLFLGFIKTVLKQTELRNTKATEAFTKE